MSDWLAQSSVSNKLKQTYFTNFIDLSGNCIIRNGYINVMNDSSFGNALIIRGNLTGRTNMYILGDASFSGNVLVRANTTINGNLFVSGNSTISGDQIRMKDVFVQRSGYITGSSDNILSIPLNQVYNITATNDITITLPSIQSSKLEGTEITFFKSASSSNNITLSVNAVDSSFIAYGGTSTTSTFPLNGAKTSVKFIITNNRWIEVGSSALTSDDGSFNNIIVRRMATLEGNLAVSGNTSVSGTLTIGNVATINANLVANGNVSIAKDLIVTGKTYGVSDASFGGKLYAIGDVSFGANVNVVGNAIVNKRFYGIGDASFGGKVYGIGDASFGANVNVVGNATINNRFYAIGDASFGANVNVVGNAVVGNRFYGIGDASFGGKLYGLGDASFGGNITLDNTTDMTKTINVYGNGFFYGTEYVNTIIPNKTQNANFVLDYNFVGLTTNTSPAAGSYAIKNAITNSDDANITTNATNIATLNPGSVVIRPTTLTNAGLYSVANKNISYSTLPTTLNIHVKINIASTNANPIRLAALYTQTSTPANNTNISILYAIPTNRDKVQIFTSSTSITNNSFIEITLSSAISTNTDTWITISQDLTGDKNCRVFINGVLSGNVNVSLFNPPTANTALSYTFGTTPGYAASNNFTLYRCIIGFDTHFLRVSDLISIFNQYPSVRSTEIRTLTIGGRLCAIEDVSLNANLVVGGTATINGNTTITKPTAIQSNLLVWNDASFGGRLYGLGDASFNSRLFVRSDASFGANVIVVGNATINNRFYGIGDASFGGKVYGIGDASFGANVNVVGNATINNRFYAIGDASFGANVNVVGNAVINNRLYAIGDASFGGNAIVTNKTTLQNGLAVYGDTTLRGGNVIVSQVLNNINIQHEYTFDSITGTADANGFYSTGATLLNNATGIYDASFGTPGSSDSTITRGELTIVRTNTVATRNGITTTFINVPTTTGSYIDLNMLMNISSGPFYIASLVSSVSTEGTWMSYRFDNDITLQVLSTGGTPAFTQLILTQRIQFNTNFWLTIRQTTSTPYTTTIFVNGVSAGSVTISDTNMKTTPTTINCQFGFLGGNALNGGSAKYKRIITYYADATNSATPASIIQVSNRYPSLYLNNLRFTIEGNSITNKNMFVLGDASFGANVNVVGNATINNRLYAIGDASFGGNAIVTNNTTLQNGLAVYGDATLRGGNVIISQVLNNMNIQHEYTFDSITGTADASGFYSTGTTLLNNATGTYDASFGTPGSSYSTLARGELTIVNPATTATRNGITATFINVPTTTGSYIDLNMLMNISSGQFFIASLGAWMVYRFDSATTLRVLSKGTTIYTTINLTTPIPLNTNFWLTIRQTTSTPYTTTIFVNGVSAGSVTISDTNMDTTTPTTMNCQFGFLGGNALNGGSAKYKRIITYYADATNSATPASIIQVSNRYPSLYLNNLRFTIEGNSITNKNMFVLGDASFGGKIYGIGDVSFGGKLYGIGDASFGGKLYTIGDASFGGNLTIVRNMNVSGSFAPNSIDMGTIGAITCGPINSTTIDTRNNNITCGTGNVSANRLTFPSTFTNRKLVLSQTADNDFQVYGIGVQTNTMQLMVDSSANSSYVFSGASSSIAKTDFATISNTGISTSALNIGGGNCIIQSSGALTSGTIQTRGNSISCGPITSTTINTAGNPITCGDITSGNILATNRTITCGNITCGNIIAGTNSIGCGPISSTTINTNNNNIACGTGTISCGSITSGAITSTTITTNSNNIDCGTGLLTAGRIRVSAITNTNRKVVLLQSTDNDTDAFYGIGADSTSKIVRFMGGDSTGSIFSFCAGGTATSSGTEYANINNTSFSIGTGRSITCGAININGAINAGSNSLTCGTITSGSITSSTINAGANTITCGSVISSAVMSTPRIHVSADTNSNRKIVLSQATDNDTSAFSGFGIITGNVVLTAISGNSFSFRQGTTGGAAGTEIAQISSTGSITCNGLNSNNNAITCGTGTITCGGATINGTIAAGTNTLNCGNINCGNINAGANTLTCGIITSGNINCGNINAGANTLTCGIITSGNINCGNINAGTNTITCGSISSSVAITIPRLRASPETNSYRKIVLYQPNDDSDTSTFYGIGANSTEKTMRFMAGHSNDSIFSFCTGGTTTTTGSEYAKINKNGLDMGTKSITCGAININGAINAGTNTLTCGFITCGNISAGNTIITNNDLKTDKVVLWKATNAFYGLGLLDATLLLNVNSIYDRFSFRGGATAGGTDAPGTEFATIRNTGITATSYNATSDVRLKSNIRPISSQWENIKTLNPSQYTWNSTSRNDCGFIAQEIYKVYPLMKPAEFVTYDTDFPVDASGTPKYYTIDYGKLTPYLCKGLQETIYEIEQLKDENKQMREEITELKSQMKLILEHMNINIHLRG